MTQGNESICLGRSKRAIRSYIRERRVYVIVRSLRNVSYLFDVYVLNYFASSRHDSGWPSGDTAE